MNFNEMVDAVTDAERIVREADFCVNRIARLVVGRLRHVDGWTLVTLKRELRDYNIRTDTWKEAGL